jgi:3-keto-disaccharide hydrolase
MRTLAAAALTMAVAVPPPAADEIRLFNGRDLSGWTSFLERSGPNAGGSMRMEDVWKVEGGRIRCSGVPNGYIRTAADYKDFVLTLEWRWAEKPGNSGVLLRILGPDKIWPKTIEAQLMSGNAGDFWLMDGATLDSDPARVDPKAANHRLKMKAAERPAGEWNVYEITMDGSWVLLKINGEVVNEGTGADEVAGKIGLQSEGAPIEFRNIRLTPIRK